MSFVFSFQNFDKVKVIIKLLVVKCNCQTQMQQMATNKQLINNGLEFAD